MRKNFYLAGLLVLSFILSSVSGKAAGFTTDPRDTSACAGTTTFFSVTDTSSLPSTISWQISLTGGATWLTLTDTLFFSGSHTDTLNVTSDTILNGTMYRAIASNASGSDTSLSAMLTVLTIPSAGTITGASSVCAGSSITLSSSVSGGSWSSSATTIASVGSDGDVSGILAGSATITYSVTNSCGTGTTTASVRVDNPAVAMPITGPASTCVGNTINLMNANVLGTSVWSTSNTNASVSSSGMVTGLAGGTVTISYTFTNACNTVVSTHLVTIDTVLDHGTISGPSEVCAGSGVTLTASVTGGIWISSNTFVAVIDPVGNVTGVSGGTSVISYYLANACGASIATDTFRVSTAASAIGPIDSVGVGDTITLSNLAPGGMWFSSDTSIATIDSFGVTAGIATGTSTISYTVTNACGTSSATLTLHVGTAPFAGGITGPDSVCVGSTITLADTVAGVWSMASGDSVTRATIDSFTGVVHGLVSGFDTAFYTVSNAFGTTVLSKIIYVNTFPVVTLTGPSIVALGGEYLFAGTPAHGTFTASNYHMGTFVSFSDSGLTATPILTFGHFIVLNTGQDTISYKVTNACGSTTKSVTIGLAGINKVKETVNETSVLTVYPNPTQGAFTINLGTDAPEQALVTITNVTGEKVKELTIPTNIAVNIKLDQPAGVYFLSATAGSGTYKATITLTK